MSHIKQAFLSPWLIVTCAVLSLPLAGFGCGVVICSDCDGNPISHLFMGLIHAALTSLSLGRCWTSSASSTNLLPYMLILAVGLWLLIGTVRYWRAKTP